MENKTNILEHNKAEFIVQLKMHDRKRPQILFFLVQVEYSENMEYQSGEDCWELEERNRFCVRWTGFLRLWDAVQWLLYPQERCVLALMWLQT